jgi:hypothetical protein
MVLQRRARIKAGPFLQAKTSIAIRRTEVVAERLADAFLQRMKICCSPYRDTA